MMIFFIAHINDGIPPFNIPRIVCAQQKVY